MPVWRLQTSVQHDSTLPRDAMVITPHFNDGGIGSDPQGLCDDLAAVIAAYIVTGGTPQVRVVAYDAQGTPPVFPQGETVLNPGVAPASTLPRETACALSYYSNRNAPKQRGRLYIPAAWISAPASMGNRPSSAQRAKVGALAQNLADIGGADVDWCVFSRVDNVPRSVSNWWVDDEWDTIRSRGLRATTRLEGTVGEA